MPKEPTKQARRYAIDSYLAEVIETAIIARTKLATAYGEGSGWTEEQLTELCNTVDILAAGKEAYCVALNAAQEDKMMCKMQQNPPT